MLKLYGVAMSNYFSMVKNALLEKDVAFEEVAAPPSQEPDYLQKSPMGKVPVIETEKGFLSESSAIIDYIEDTYPAVSLYPSDAFERAKVKELIRVVELYVEVPAHGMLGLVLGGDVPEAVQAHYKPLLERGLAALGRLASFSPFMAGEKLTYADLCAFWSLSLTGRIAKIAYQKNIFDEVEGLGEWNRRMLEREITSRLVAESQAFLERFMASRAK